MPLTAHFWGWDAPVLEKAVAELTRGWKGGELDLSQLVIIVPTAESVRRLREALAAKAAEKDGAVTAPHVWHPETALLAGWMGGKIASRLEERVAWMRVLDGIDVADHAGLFPVKPTNQGATWAATVAETFAALRRALGGGGHDLRSTALTMAGSEDEERWNDLARLEEKYLGQINRMSRADAQEAKRALAANPRLPDGVREMIVIAAPDLTSQMGVWLRSAAKKLPVSIFVSAPEAEKGTFDDIGTPHGAAWGAQSARRLPIREDMISLASAPQDQARESVTELRDFAGRGLSAVVGACVPELNAHLESELAAEGVVAYDPSGRRAQQHSLIDFLNSWLAMIESGAWKPLSGFVRRHDVLDALSKTHDMKQRDLLSALDALHDERLPATLDDAIALCDPKKQQPLCEVLQDIARRLEPWKQGSADTLRGTLQWIYAHRQFNTEHDHDGSIVELMGEIMDVAGALDAALGGHEIDGLSWLSLLLAEVGQKNLSERRGEADLVLHGWLELLWEPARGLVIAGFNDEHVPGAVTPDPFLSDSLRKKLGLACSESRHARDAYLLTAIAEQRKSGGALRLIVGRRSDEGDVLRPSRLIFACDDAALLQRIGLLFPDSHGETGAAVRPARSIAWKLRPPKPRVALEQVSASLLSAYLRCPLRCYFSYLLKMGEAGDAARELGFDAFGKLIHEVWRRFAADKEMVDTVNEELIAEFLSNTADLVARERYGECPLFSVAMQVESAKQRLRALAKTQRKLRQEGWRIESAELPINAEEKLLIAGVPFKGQIDRVDKHEKSGALRIWDYKTGSRGDPRGEHLEQVALVVGGEQDVMWRSYSVDGDKAVVWKNLQLPLYVWAMQQKNPGVEVTAGYLHLPAVVSGASDHLWDELDCAMALAAHECAGKVVGRMQSGVFWPPQEVAFDDWEELFMGDPLEAVAPPAEWREDAA